MKKNILYIQFTNPAAYPPLEHSSRLLAENGWNVEFFGTGGFGAADMRFPFHKNIRVRQLRFLNAGPLQKLQYIRFCLYVILLTLRSRPRWVYASDPLSCPAALFLAYFFRQRVIYHEHDAPSRKKDETLFMKFIFFARARLARIAKITVIPNETRLKNFCIENGPPRNAICVWNCPSLEEVAHVNLNKSEQDILLFYHGSITPVRLPMTILEAMAMMPKNIRLQVVGYQTVGHPDYVDQFKRKAVSLGVADRLDMRGPVLHHHELFALCKAAHIGISFMPKKTDDANEIAMTGASNKSFEYLACGLALLVSDLPDWEALFSDAGYGLACNPDEAGSIANSLRWFLDHPSETKRMGESGRYKILKEWNYEKMFLPVMERLEKI